MKMQPGPPSGKVRWSRVFTGWLIVLQVFQPVGSSGHLLLQEVHFVRFGSHCLWAGVHYNECIRRPSKCIRNST